MVGLFRQLFALSVYHISTQSWLSHYSGDAHPSVLFTGVKFRLTILLQEVFSNSPDRLHTTKFQRWQPDGRANLFSSIEYSNVSPETIRLGLIPKVDSQGLAWLKRAAANKKILGQSVLRESAHVAFAHRIVAHYVKAFNFVPFFRSERDGEKRSEDYKPFPLASRKQLSAFSAVLNSSQFYLWFVAYSDVYHCGRELILDYPCDLEAIEGQIDLIRAADALMDAYRASAVRRAIPYKKTGLVEYDEFYPRTVKTHLDSVDIELAKAVGVPADLLDYLVNYDVKYRMSGTDDDEE